MRRFLLLAVLALAGCDTVVTPAEMTAAVRVCAWQGGLRAYDADLRHAYCHDGSVVTRFQLLTDIKEQ